MEGAPRMNDLAFPTQRLPIACRFGCTACFFLRTEQAIRRFQTRDSFGSNQNRLGKPRAALGSRFKKLVSHSETC